MKTYALICCLTIFGTLANATFIYNVDFESPPHILDSQVVTGSGADRPSSADSSVIVRSGLADFASQVASLEPAGAMGFGPSGPVDSDISLISWDMAMLSLGAGGPETAAISMDTSPSGSGGIAVVYLNSFDIRVAGQNVDTFSLGQRDHFEFWIDFENDYYDLSINSSIVLDDEPVPGNFDIANILFSRDFLASPEYAVDNFQWQIIPEPSTVLLLALGGFGLAVSRFRGRG